MKRTIIVCITILMMASVASAQQVEFSSSLNPVGSGARATGMGGAFIGVADDATAASWNPAGLVQLERPEVSLVYAAFQRDQTYHSSTHPEIEGTNSMSANGVNYLSAVYPFKAFERNMVVSFNYQRLFEMNKKVGMRYDWQTGLVDDIDFKQDGYLYALSPAFAAQVVPSFYLGVTLNFWQDLAGTNGWKNTYHATGSGTVNGSPLTHQVDWTNTVDFEGTNANAGFLWSMSPKFTLGGVYKTGFDAKLKKKSIFATSQVFGGVASNSATESAEELTMKMPASYGAGLQYRHSDSLTVAFDVYRTLWSQFLVRDSAGNEINPIDGNPVGQGRPADTTQLRLGVERLFIGSASTVALRGGVFSDPEPGAHKTDGFRGFSLGAGYSTAAYALDASYQYRTGKDVSGDIAVIPGSSADITQHTVMVSGIYYF